MVKQWKSVKVHQDLDNYITSIQSNFAKQGFSFSKTNILNMLIRERMEELNNDPKPRRLPKSKEWRLF